MRLSLLKHNTMKAIHKVRKLGKVLTTGIQINRYKAYTFGAY